ncbi:MAG: DUF1836 domain-containing protein [Clostridiales bacterium]|jgi:hypothetical protein|nr:DUF1836 domain-containing protein [Clostridiales bacterium]
MKLNHEEAEKLHCPRFNELPSLSLYMDQVVFVIEESFAVFTDETEKVITSTMINNYVKQKIVAPPEKKKYNKNHIAVLVIVSMLKRVLSISEISALIAEMQKEYSLEQFYNLFCERFERLIKDAFAETDEPITISRNMLDCALGAFVGKLVVQNNLQISE